ncbi:hypothetical protein DO021_18735 [Desulfobacter hydrogenophilus]|uniref:Uncharacterized protein n=1 Tax=Desulfobacter hydrogenophilus TaxID=2291 RepID=A0A328F785_9BACT|nr:hypothetical protein EYB58_10950 [Desulfobacter hydrogenophilus]RAM00484.1 hypothetical protein DO021_18735 [Desulfobacter hydrogenophilus]
MAVIKNTCRVRLTQNAPTEGVSARETPPQYWGDITLWEQINALADREPPLVKIEGPSPRLPQWEGLADLKLFRVHSM